MTGPEIRELLTRVHRGDLSPAEAEDHLTDHLRTLPFENLGFARVDHHRSLRQGFPEVILGLGKTPAEIAGIAERIVARGQTLVVPAASGDWHVVGDVGLLVCRPGTTWPPITKGLT